MKHRHVGGVSHGMVYDKYQDSTSCWFIGNGTIHEFAKIATKYYKIAMFA